jgi:hypothetical protein
MPSCDARLAGQPHNLRCGHGDLFRGSLRDSASISAFLPERTPRDATEAEPQQEDAP